MNNIWQQLRRPFFVLAPMDDVTDVVFREVVAEVAPPDLFFTEFTNCDALFSAGREAHIGRLRYTERQRPIIAQIWGANPENYFKTAQLLSEMGFNGIDINMGCPDKNVRKSGSCSALIDNPSLAKEIIEATREGGKGLPISVKTRLGVKAVDDSWITFLLQQHLAAITIHGRTVKEMSKVPAHWDEIARIVQLKNTLSIDTIIVGNGDVKSREEAFKRAEESGVDGVMMGRGIFEDLYLFHPDIRMKNLSLDERLQLLMRHILLFEQEWNEQKRFDILKKFLKVYISDFPSASTMRNTFAQTKNIQEMKDAVTSLLKTAE